MHNIAKKDENFPCRFISFWLLEFDLHILKLVGSLCLIGGIEQCIGSVLDVPTLSCTGSNETYNIGMVTNSDHDFQFI